MPTTIASASEVRSADAALAVLRQHLQAMRGIAGRVPDLATRDFRDDEALADFLTDADSLAEALDAADARIALCLSGLRDLTETGEITYAEHVAQERAMHRWRSVA